MAIQIKEVIDMTNIFKWICNKYVEGYEELYRNVSEEGYLAMARAGINPYAMHM